MKHTIKLLTLAFMLATILTLTGCPGPVNNYIEPPVWDDGVVTTEPTCTTEGVKTYTCSNGETRTETIPALGHDMGDWVWGEWTTTKEMTYQQDEEKTRSGTRTCKRCGHTENKTQTEVTSRFVAGGYDGNDVPTENEETYRYQYADGIKFHLYVTTQTKYNETYGNNTNTVRLYSALRSNDSSDIWDDYYLSFDASTYSELIEKYGNLFKMVRQFDGTDMVEYCKIPVDKLLNLKGINNDFKWTRNTSNTTLKTEKDEFCFLTDSTDNIMEFYIVTTN